MQAHCGNSTFDLQHDQWGRLVLIDEAGRRHEGVEPVRTFPISDPDHWISICDEGGRELVSVEDPTTLSPAVRDFLEGDLSRREFVPVIRRILSVPVNAEPTEWEVETDRGPTRFLLNSVEDVRRLGPHRAQVVDSQGIRYLIEDTRQLDSLSRRVLDRYVNFS